MKVNERAYDFHQLLNTANTLNRLASIEYKDNGLKFGRVHNKMKNVWADLHPLVEGEVVCNLSDYTLIATDDDVTVALQEGLKEAQSMLRVLNMSPSVHCANKVWFMTPWLVEKEDPHNFAYVLTKSPVRGEDDDGEVLRANIETNALDHDSVDSNSNTCIEGEVDIVEDGAPNLLVVEFETQDAISEMLNLEEPQISTDKVIPFVNYDGHYIYKSTLVSQLNANPFLSKDRLTKVKKSIYFNNSDDYIDASSSTEKMLLGLGMDCGVYFMQRSTTTISSTVKSVVRRTRGGLSKKFQPTCVLNGVDRGTWCIGRVQKMRRKVGTRWGNCRHPIDLLNREVNKGKKTSIAGSGCMVYFNYFRKVPGHFKFKYDHSDSIWVDVDSIICTVTMSFDVERDVFELDPVDGNSLNEFVEKST